MCHSQTAKPRSWFPTSWNAPVPWRYLAMIRMETGTVCNSRADMERKLQLKAWNQMACVMLWHSNAYIMSNYMTFWSSSMAPKIWQQGFACHTECLGCQCSVTLRCIIPGCQGTIFWQSVKWCRKYWGIVSWVNLNLTNIGSFKWSHWTQSFIESRHEKKTSLAPWPQALWCVGPPRADAADALGWFVLKEQEAGRTKHTRLQRK